MSKTILLRNNLSLIQIAKKDTKLFNISLFVQAGSSLEDGYYPQGTSNFVEKLILTGTEKHPSSDSIHLAIESLGGSFYSSTSYEYTFFSLTVPSFNKFKAVGLLSEIIQKTYISRDKIEKLKRQLTREIPNIYENYDDSSLQLSMSSVYKDTGLGANIKGTADRISDISIEDVEEYLSRQYQPANCILSIGGNFEYDDVSAIIEQEWGNWHAKSRNSLLSVEPEIEEIIEMFDCRQKVSDQTQITLNFRLDMGYLPTPYWPSQELETKKPYNDVLSEFLVRYAGLLLLSTILGDGQGSKLYQKTVIEDKLANHTESNLLFFKFTGILQLIVLCENGDFNYVLESVLKTLDNLQKNMISITELMRAKSCLKAKIININENLGTMALWNALHISQTQLEFSIDQLFEVIDGFDANDIRNLSKEIFSTKNLTIATLGTAKGTKILEKLVVKYLDNL